MTTSKILPVGFLAICTVLSGLTIATAQSTSEAQPAVETGSAKSMPVNFKKGRAQRGAPMMLGAMMKNVDANNDGAITQAEIDTFRAGLVGKADASGDGNITLDEFETIYVDLMHSKMVDAFQRLDEDGDGTVTQAEMDQRFGSVVEKMDRNGDGQLDSKDRGKRGDRGDRGDRKDRGDRGDHQRRGHNK